MVIDITTSIALCSSPTTFGSPQNSAGACPAMEMDLFTRMTTTHNVAPKPVVPGLSALLANMRHSNSSCAGDPSDLSSMSNSFMRGSYPDSWKGTESSVDSLSFLSPSPAKVKVLSPVSVLQGPLAYCTGHSYGKVSNIPYLVDQQLGNTVRLSSLSGNSQEVFIWEEEEIRFSCCMPEEHLGSFSRPCKVVAEPYELLSLNLGRTAEDILLEAQTCHEIFKDPFVVKAFYEAEKAHQGQYRASGDAYLVHCVETAMILATIGASKVVVAAGLLHDIMDESSADYTELQDTFGQQVAELVEGVSKMSEFSKLARDNDTASNTVEADRLHTMFLAMADVRVVLTKLADRLHNMRTLGALPEAKQMRIAKETLQVFVPLANRLGIWSWKSELEDLCFKHLKPKEHQKLHDKLKGGFRKETIVAAIEKLEKTLLEEGILYHDLRGRSKSLYGIYIKMLRKGKNLEEVQDLQGLRLIMTNKEDCYEALEIVHRLWPQTCASVKDYIKEPKTNGYQSLHTIVQGEDGFPLEIQIRTKEMHYQAEFGVAAHWRYKEDNVEHSPFILQMVEWARWMLTWQSEIVETRSRLPFCSANVDSACPFPDHRKGCPHFQALQTPPQRKEDPLFVIIVDDEKMAVQELPGGSTVADLLYTRIKEDSFAATCGVGFHEELRPRVNHKIVDNIHQVLKTGDLVEIIPLIPNDSLTEYRNRIQRMFDDTVVQPRGERKFVQMLP